MLQLISELTNISWQTPYSSRVSSLTNHQYTTVNGDDININDFIEDVDSLNSSQIIKLKEQALKEGKPEQIVEKIAQGKLQKFLKDNGLSLIHI